jgi:flavin reductase (DIM6/NTAB) family NADH-FMN oxidoreductase RutF
MNVEAFFKISYGLYVVSSVDKKGTFFNGFISNTVFQVSADPPMFAAACNKNNFTATLINDSQSFCVSVLQKNTRDDIIGTFGYKSGKDTKKFNSFQSKQSLSGCPVLLDDTIAWFDCRVTQNIDVGTHWLYIAMVVDTGILDDTKEPLTYAYYRDVKKGKAPKNAPTYINPDLLTQAVSGSSEIWKCAVCGYQFQEALGDATNNIPAGTSFDSLPDNWKCPVCGTDKSDFYKL